jgi:hypothetical protein
MFTTQRPAKKKQSIAWLTGLPRKLESPKKASTASTVFSQNRRTLAWESWTGRTGLGLSRLPVYPSCILLKPPKPHSCRLGRIALQSWANRSPGWPPSVSRFSRKARLFFPSSSGLADTPKTPQTLRQLAIKATVYATPNSGNIQDSRRRTWAAPFKTFPYSNIAQRLYKRE